MSAILIDTLRLAHRLEQAGFSRDQAAGTAEAFSDALASDLVTKPDLLAATSELRGEIASVKSELSSVKAELKGDIASVRAELKGDIASVRTEISTLRSSTATWILTAVLFNGVLVIGVAATLYSLLRSAIASHP